MKGGLVGAKAKLKRLHSSKGNKNGGVPKSKKRTEDQKSDSDMP